VLINKIKLSTLLRLFFYRQKVSRPSFFYAKLVPVKLRIKEIAALLLVQRLRKTLGLGLGSMSVGLLAAAYLQYRRGNQFSI